MVSKKILKRICSGLSAPARAYPVAYATMCLALFLPEFFGARLQDVPRILREGIVCNLQLCNVVVYVLILVCYAFRCWKKTIGNVVCLLVLVLTLALLLADYQLFYFFGTHISAYILQLINETNATESAEFFATYCLNPRFLRVLLLLPVLLVFAAVVDRVVILLARNERWKFYCSVLFAGYLLWSVAQLINRAPAFTQNVISNCDYANRKSKIGRSFMYIIYNTVLQFVQDKAEFDDASRAQDAIQATYQGGAPDYLIVVIGESHNKYHSSLYGYRHRTNPNLEQMEGLCVFNDVITSVNATSQSFKSFLSLASRDGDKRWCDVPLVPAIFKKAGYNVVFYSNQFVHDPTNDLYDASCGFFNHPSMRDKLFSHKNKYKYPYDGQLIDAYKAERCRLESSDTPNLIFFHLMGQHVRADERYPLERSHFLEKDYAYRKDLTSEQRKYVASYDNATLYNDSVLNQIIAMYADQDAMVIYFSDHGDEVYDFRDHVGRSYDFKTGGRQAIHHQMDIPFLIYSSDSCRSAHPLLCAKVERATNRPFMTDDLPHMLLEIGCIATPSYVPTRSLINEQYNVGRPRKPRAITPTVTVDYDVLCSKEDKLFKE